MVHCTVTVVPVAHPTVPIQRQQYSRAIILHSELESCIPWEPQEQRSLTRGAPKGEHGYRTSPQGVLKRSSSRIWCCSYLAAWLYRPILHQETPQSGKVRDERWKKASQLITVCVSAHAGFGFSNISGKRAFRALGCNACAGTLVNENQSLRTLPRDKT